MKSHDQVSHTYSPHGPTLTSQVLPSQILAATSVRPGTRGRASCMHVCMYTQDSQPHTGTFSSSRNNCSPPMPSRAIPLSSARSPSPTRPAEGTGSLSRGREGKGSSGKGRERKKRGGDEADTQKVGKYRQVPGASWTLLARKKRVPVGGGVLGFFVH